MKILFFVNKSNFSGDDDVRPPIPPVRQVLVEDYPSVSYANHHPRRTNSIFDNFRDFEAESSNFNETILLNIYQYFQNRMASGSSCQF